MFFIYIFASTLGCTKCFRFKHFHLKCFIKRLKINYLIHLSRLEESIFFWLQNKMNCVKKWQHYTVMIVEATLKWPNLMSVNKRKQLNFTGLCYFSKRAENRLTDQRQYSPIGKFWNNLQFYTWQENVLFQFSSHSPSPTLI